MRALQEYVRFGGFPEVVLSETKNEILSVYFEDILTKAGECISIFLRKKIRFLTERAGEFSKIFKKWKKLTDLQ